MRKNFESKTILLVNENKILGNAFMAALSEEGFCVSEFHSVPFPEYKKDLEKKIQNLFFRKVSLRLYFSFPGGFLSGFRS